MKKYNLRKNHVKLLKFKSQLYKFEQLKFGFFGIQALESGILTLKQVEATRRVLSRALKRKTKIWIKTNFTVSTSAKPKAIRMGKGKGALNQPVSYVCRGNILFEVGFISYNAAKYLFSSAKKKLPVKAQLVWKKNSGW